MSKYKVALVTGSAKRLGKHTVQHLHKNNYNVIVHCNHSEQKARYFVAELNEIRAHSAKLVVGDIARQASKIAEQAIAAFGQLDVLVNNASSFYPTPLESFTQQDWDSLIGSNMQGPLFLSQKLHKYLAEKQGVIINMVDIHAKSPLYNHTLYCMAKAGLVMMTQSLAKELAPDIRVNGIAPGAILWPEQQPDEKSKRQVLNQIPLQRLGEEQDIAEAIWFLINAHYITGQILAVDGGKSIGGSSIV